MKHNHVVIWGVAPPSPHTHGYIHGGYARGFNYLNVPVYWVDQTQMYNPGLPDLFKNALVFTEAFMVHGMPLDKSSTYMVHYLGNRGPIESNPGPDYFLGRVGRLIDVRYNADSWIDKNYNYVLDRSKCEKVGGSLFEKGKDYDYMYTLFATDLLPHEINLEDRFATRDENKFAFFAGTVRPDNENKIPPFLRACEESDVRFVHNDTWKTPLSTQQIRETMKRAYMAPDFRGDTTHLAHRYIPCRTFKNISYGQMGVTNAPAVYEFFNGEIAYHDDPYLMFYHAVAKMFDYETIRKSMEFVRDHHTYVNRCQELIDVCDNH